MIESIVDIRGQMAEKNIRQKVEVGHYVVSTHANDRMSERKIELEKVIDCILTGKRIENQIGKQGQDFKVLFQESSKTQPEIYTVVADRDVPVIVTVCRTKEEVWEYVGNVLKRREMHKK